MTRLEEIKFACNNAALEVIDAKLNEELNMDRKVWIMDKHLPTLLPALERAVEAAMREFYDLLPESLDVPPEAVEHTTQQWKQSQKNLDKLRKIMGVQ